MFCYNFIPDAASDSVREPLVIRQVYSYSALCAYMWWPLMVIFFPLSAQLLKRTWPHSTFELSGSHPPCRRGSVSLSPEQLLKVETRVLFSLRLNTNKDTQRWEGESPWDWIWPQEKKTWPVGLMFKQNKAKAVTRSNYGEAIRLIFIDR